MQNYVATIIAVFALISIAASALSIVDLVNSGSTDIVAALGVSCIGDCVVCVLVADFDVEEIMEVFITMEFNDVRNEYKKVRVEQQNIIYKYLKEKSSLNITKIHNKRGSNKYKSGSRFIEPYDLSNWLWIDLQINKVNFLISLQSFDCDFSTGNMHVLMDRIGIYAYGGEYSPKEAREKMMITSINLPMNDEKEKMLKNILEDLSKCDSFAGDVQLHNIKTKYNII